MSNTQSNTVVQERSTVLKFLHETIISPKHKASGIEFLVVDDIDPIDNSLEDFDCHYCSQDITNGDLTITDRSSMNDLFAHWECFFHAPGILSRLSDPNYPQEN